MSTAPDRLQVPTSMPAGRHEGLSRLGRLLLSIAALLMAAAGAWLIVDDDKRPHRDGVTVPATHEAPIREPGLLGSRPECRLQFHYVADGRTFTVLTDDARLSYCIPGEAPSRWRVSYLEPVAPDTDPQQVRLLHSYPELQIPVGVLLVSGSMLLLFRKRATRVRAAVKQRFRRRPDRAALLSPRMKKTLVLTAVGLWGLNLAIAPLRYNAEVKSIGEDVTAVVRDAAEKHDGDWDSGELLAAAGDYQHLVTDLKDLSYSGGTIVFTLRTSNHKPSRGAREYAARCLAVRVHGSRVYSVKAYEADVGFRDGAC